jgi:alkyl sulfatase BDS1-like metallo-beta-lactamase superfamily hydrolase
MEKLSIDIVLTDIDTCYRLWLADGVLTYSSAEQAGEADATITGTKTGLPALASRALTPEKLAAAGIEVSGDASVLARLVAVLDPGDKNFAIVTP